MLDRHALRMLKPAIDLGASGLHRMGCNADHVTLTGFAFGVVAAAFVATGHFTLAIALILASRAMDGLDGAVARLCGTTDRGAFLDIGFDFLFYAAIPLAFALANPPANGLAAAVLLAAFIGTGSSFLAYAVIAEKRGLKSTAYPSKSFYYLGGLTEGTETVACFLAMCLWPSQFAAIAYVYAGLCMLTTATRLVAGWKAFS